MIGRLSPAPFSVEEVSKVDSDLSAANIIVRIAAGIITDQFKPLMKIESDGVCIAGFLTSIPIYCFASIYSSKAVYSRRYDPRFSSLTSA